jgi:hypothetical protein
VINLERDPLDSRIRLRFEDGIRDRLGYVRWEKHPTAGTHLSAEERREGRDCWLGRTGLLVSWAGPRGRRRGKAAAAHCAGSGEQAVGPLAAREKVSGFSFFFLLFFIYLFSNYSK